MHTLIKICKDIIYLRLFSIGALRKEFPENSFLTFIVAHDMVSANGATSEPQYYKKSDGSQDARRGSLNILNEPLPLYDHFKIWRFLGLNWQY